MPVGRKPKPPDLKLVTGNPGKRPIKRAPTAPGALERPPDWLTAEQKTSWRYAVRCAPLGLLRKADRAVLAGFIVAESIHRDASRKVAEFGLLTKTPRTGEPMQSPYLPIVNRQFQLMLRAATELGFTPVARARVDNVAAGDGEDEEDGERKPQSAARFFD